jgi:CrcB protein
MKVILAVAIGGAIGATARYAVVGLAGRWLGDGFPWGTLAVNVLGCLVMGILTEAMAIKWSVGPELRALLTVGILGGFTTFSSFALDAAMLNDRAAFGIATIYIVASVLLSLFGFYAGLWAVRQSLT